MATQDDIDRLRGAEPVRDLEWRVSLTTSCRDSDPIPKVEHAGECTDENGIDVQIMHNGLRVIRGGYYGDWMARIIHDLRGHHEPQEERLFHEVLNHIGPAGTMIELGCHWSYYSLWFLKDQPGRRALGIEPDPRYLDVGRRNAELNGLPFEIRQGYIGSPTEAATTFETESSGPQSVGAFSPRELVGEFAPNGLDILHCDIQGAELYALQDCTALLRSGQIRFAVLSTHALEITGDPLTHQLCLEAIRSVGGRVLAEHDVHESYSGDGLIVAYFGAEPIDFPDIPLSRNRYATSLFPTPLYGLAEAMLPGDPVADNAPPPAEPLKSLIRRLFG